MIKVFLTVGVQLPFDRLVSAIFHFDDYFEVKGQVGTTALQLPSHYKQFMSNDEYIQSIKWCDVVVSHAGMGSILTSLEYNKPAVLLPRLASLGEHRNDHQLDTVKNLSKVSGESSLIYTLTDVNEIKDAIIRQSKLEEQASGTSVQSNLDNLAKFLNEQVI